MDKEKIDEIYRQNAAMIYKYLWGLTQDSGIAEELTQETFFQAIFSLSISAPHIISSFQVRFVTNIFIFFYLKEKPLSLTEPFLV